MKCTRFVCSRTVSINLKKNHRFFNNYYHLWDRNYVQGLSAFLVFSISFDEIKTWLFFYYYSHYIGVRVRLTSYDCWVCVQEKSVSDLSRLPKNRIVKGSWFNSYFILRQTSKIKKIDKFVGIPIAHINNWWTQTCRNVLLILRSRLTSQQHCRCFPKNSIN